MSTTERPSGFSAAEPPERKTNSGKSALKAHLQHCTHRFELTSEGNQFLALQTASPGEGYVFDETDRPYNSERSLSISRSLRYASRNGLLVVRNTSGVILPLRHRSAFCE